MVALTPGYVVMAVCNHNITILKSFYKILFSAFLSLSQKSDPITSSLCTVPLLFFVHLTSSFPGTSALKSVCLMGLL